MIKHILFKFFNLLSYILCLGMIFFGIFMLFDEDQSLSYYRIFLFVVLPITYAITLLLSNKEYRFIIIVTTFFSIIVIIFFENYLIRGEKNLVNTNAKLSNTNLLQLCPFHYSSFNDLKLFPLGGKPSNLTATYNAKSNLFHYYPLDNHGFNNKKNWDEFSKFNYIFLGDSFTYGADVTRDSSFVNLFKEEFRNTLNLGCNGNGPISELAAFREYVKILKPKIVFINYYRNDLGGDLVRENNSFYYKYLNDKNFTQNLLKKNNDIFEVSEYVYSSIIKSINKKNKSDQKIIREKTQTDIKENIKEDITKRIQFNKLIPQITTESLNLRRVRMLLGIKYGFDRKHFEQYKEILNEINTDIKKWGGTFVFVYIPSESQFKDIFNFLDSYFYDINIFNFLDKNKIRYINLFEEFNKFN